MSLFGLPNGRTDWRATYTPSGSGAAMPLMFSNFLRRLTIPEPWHSEVDGRQPVRSCRNWIANRTAIRSWIASRTATRNWSAFAAWRVLVTAKHDAPRFIWRGWVIAQLSA